MLISAQQSSCKRKLPQEQIIPATTARSEPFLKEQLHRKIFEDWESLSARAKIYTESSVLTTEAYANLIWIRDSALWLNVKKLGIEAVRALVTRDSIFVINRLDKTYQAQAIESLQREYSLPDGFPFLQQFLLSKAWLAEDIDLRADIQDSLHRLSGSNSRFAVDYRIEEGSFVLRRETFVQQRDSRILSLLFGGFDRLQGAGIFPYIRRIEAFSPETGSVSLDLEFTDIEINVPKSYRFEVPDHYTRIE